ncbi:conserved hypothetical protein [Pelobacter propionicus DSM 2379]|uniref:Uncharacterized protein n=1 Tax=Pelobacter propionicus (strain DSM 2379 / NBRC 103807 / OttBd1) TaxID=338966 RepID=A1AKN5_PELPD|nr:conserved hypothetical protein [Pelobacter propionicus DSM 2379]
MTIVIAYLRQQGLTVIHTGNAYHLTEGMPNINVVIKAFRDQAISIAEDGTIHLFGIYLPSGWDTVRIRRKVEDHLRKISSTEEIIRIASCLGVKLSETVK